MTVLLGLLASLIIPRVVGQEERRTDLFLRQVQDLVTMFAFRESMGAEQVGIWQNPLERSLELVILRTDPEYPEDPPQWVSDPLTPRVVLPENVFISDARMDGQSMGMEDWLITSSPGSIRPSVEIDIATERSVTTIALPSYAVTALRDDEASGQSIREVFDLDSSGRDREDW